MVKKKNKKKSGFKKEVKKLNKIVKKLDKKVNIIEDNIEKEAEEIEQWVVERKKFLIKFGWVVGLIVALLIFSHFYLRTGGFG